MSLGDLRRLIYRATPRVDDVRSPDRTEFVKRETKHMSFREVVDALDGMGFTADSFLRRMRVTMATPDEAAHVEQVTTAKGLQPLCGGKAAAAETAVHGLFRVLDGLEVLALALPAESPVEDEEAVSQESEPQGGEDWREIVQAARAEGAECFKRQDFRAAAERYSAAIAAAPRGEKDAETHALYSNRSAALLGIGDAKAALADARRCVQLAQDWPKGYFREGCSLRELGRLAEAIGAFEAGAALEPENKVWPREVEKTEKLLRVKPASLVRQLVLNLAPEILRSWSRGKQADGVLQLQIMGDLDQLGMPKWSLIQEKVQASKAQVRYAFLSRRDYLANLAANLQKPPAGDSVAVADLEGKPLKIAEIASFMEKCAGASAPKALFHIDIKSTSLVDNRMMALVGSIDCGEDVQVYVPIAKDPAPPKGTVEAVLKLQQSSGFPKALPRLLGFQSLPGDLNFPVIDIARDAPSTA